jgi:hypothetical protein
MTPNTLAKYGISPIHVNSRLNKQTPHSAPITVGLIKFRRLVTKNQRRMRNGLELLRSYAEC